MRSEGTFSLPIIILLKVSAREIDFNKILHKTITCKNNLVWIKHEFNKCHIVKTFTKLAKTRKLLNKLKSSIVLLWNIAIVENKCWRLQYLMQLLLYLTWLSKIFWAWRRHPDKTGSWDAITEVHGEKVTSLFLVAWSARLPRLFRENILWINNVYFYRIWKKIFFIITLIKKTTVIWICLSILNYFSLF